MRKKRQPIAEEVHALGELSRGLIDPPALERLHQALLSPHALVVARAARIVKDRRLDGFAPALLAAFERFQTESDPGCAAKLAAIEALDFADHPDARPFLAAARIVQLEPAWGGAVDVAAPLRARAVLALANLGYPDILLLGGELLADAAAAVRQAAAGALAHSGARAGAGLLLVALGRGEEDPNVLVACMAGLLTLAPDWGLPRLREILLGVDPEMRELAAVALGESNREDALDLLLEFVDTSPLARDRAVVLSAVGLHRSDRAVEALLQTIARGRTPDATAAIHALGSRKFDARLRQRVREAVAERPEAAVAHAFAEVFDVEPT